MGTTRYPRLSRIDDNTMELTRKGKREGWEKGESVGKPVRTFREVRLDGRSIRGTNGLRSTSISLLLSSWL